MQKILVAYDGSEHAGRALAWARQLALLQKKKAEIHIVTAIAPHVSELELPPEEHDKLEARVQRTARANLNRQAQALEAEGLQVITHCDDGRPADVIVDVAEQVDADLIVVGSRGLGSVQRLLLGSVSIEVVQRAHRPVTVVH